MAESRTSVAPRRTAARGRIDKRQAILDAAFRVFAREGYGQACVKEIAAEAGVAKPTIYNHMHDKESLFRESTAAVAARLSEGHIAALEPLREAPDDLADVLTEVGCRLLALHCSDESWALRRLLYAEGVRFPELLETVAGQGDRRLREALADRLARVALAGRMRTPDPDGAAEQFLALLTGPMEARSALGTRDVPEGERRGVAEAAVRTFLMAYGPS
ncbi:TetR/AcrR family transcriptional regulator [Streptomyces sp. NPDC087440]|uniref:TetR/AcrR family transcriptional regulator n=1 Tax=Streptomyces sp. NPDC087440 TaxID=3365790 RepID=UPI003801A4A7